MKFALLVQRQTRALAGERNVPLAMRAGIHVGEVAKVPGYLYLPKKSSPPYQTILFFPGANAIQEQSSETHVSDLANHTKLRTRAFPAAEK